MVKKSLLLLVLATLAWQPAMATEEITPALLRSMEKVIPGLKPDRVSRSPIEGLYELVFGPHVIYVTKDGRYMVRGDVFDLANRKNLTEGKRKKARLDAINGLDEDTMIVFAPKKARYTMTVFTDITCPYCQKLHRDMDVLNGFGIKVRYLAYPRAGLASPAYSDMVSVWCADNPQKAITDAKAGLPVTPKSCDNPVAEHFNMGRLMGISGTPTIILDGGEMVPGYAPPQQLVRMLESGEAGLARR